jgi:hypothetical protein
MVMNCELLEEIPRIGKTFLVPNASPLAFPNIPENRFLLAVARQFSDEPEKFRSFMLRFLAWRQLSKHPLMKKYVREIRGERKVHCAVFEVVATEELSDKDEFEPESFFKKLREVAARKDRE